jgi:hypothetical protein
MGPQSKKPQSHQLRLLPQGAPGFQTRVVDLHDVLNIAQVISWRKHITNKPFTVIRENKSGN